MKTDSREILYFLPFHLYLIAVDNLLNLELMAPNIFDLWPLTKQKLVGDSWCVSVFRDISFVNFSHGFIRQFEPQNDQIINQIKYFTKHKD